MPIWFIIVMLFITYILSGIAIAAFNISQTFRSNPEMLITYNLTKDITPMHGDVRVGFFYNTVIWVIGFWIYYFIS